MSSLESGKIDEDNDKWKEESVTLKIENEFKFLLLIS